MINTHPIATKHPSSKPTATGAEGLSSEPVQAFCQRHQCLDEVDGVVQIARECFDVSTIKLSLQNDPETHGNWIEVAVDAAGTVQQLIDAEHRFLLRLRDVVPAQKRDYFRLYLTSTDD